MRITIIILLVFCVKIAHSQGFSQQDTFTFGNFLMNVPAPDFRAATLDGKTFHLDSMKGKVVLIDIWSLSCSACFKEIPDLNELQKKYPKDKFYIISLMDNSKEELLEKFEPVNGGYKLKKPVYGNDRIEFQIIPDAKKIIEMYTDKLVFPRAFILDQEGTINYHNLGYAEARGIPGELTTLKMFSREIERLLYSSR